MDQAVFVNLPLRFLGVQNRGGILLDQRTIGLPEMIHGSVADYLNEECLGRQRSSLRSFRSNELL